MNPPNKHAQSHTERSESLITQLKDLWSINSNSKDPEAYMIIQDFIASLAQSSLDSVSQEEFDIQKKVLAKTREKTEALLRRLEQLNIKS